MSKTETIAVKDLRLDLENYRMVKQASEVDAIHAMKETRPERFWALMESLVDDGYLPTENILVLDESGKGRTVKEGNRRIAALKLILGQIKDPSIQIPAATAAKIAGLTKVWKSIHSRVPCSVYTSAERPQLDRIIQLAHGKGEQASRDQWNAIARARHNRDHNKISEPALDLLEAYLTKGKNLTPVQAARWGGEFPLTVLDDAMKRLAGRCGATNAKDLSVRYPNINHRTSLDGVIYAIGQKQLTFPVVRDAKHDFAVDFGFPPLALPAKKPTAKKTPAGKDKNVKKPSSGSAPKPAKAAALSITDPRAVKRALAGLQILGNGRNKVVAFRDEVFKLDIADTPMTFCLVLRTMFEISAKAYCKDHKAKADPLVSVTKSDGREKSLDALLKDIIAHLINASANKAEMRHTLHGSLTEFSRADGLLSVTSMNQVVHSTSFTITPADISSRFGNVFPLLEALNA